jgi:hypothetical protein
MTTTLHYPAIKGIEFINNTVLFVHLDNDRTFIVPVDKFPALKKLSPTDKKDFEIIDEKYLSFLSIDEIFSIEDLIGIQ